MGMNVFAQIRKVDEEKRLIYARAAEEVVDKSDEIMDYASSKPFFQKWSESVAKDSGGKSLGNLRAMHGKVAAGKLTGIEFLDDAKAVDVVTKVVDDQEWRKVLEGVYTGLSIGGSYVGEKKVEKMEGRDVTRYTASPNEISLVDRPCIPTATFFEVQKADGSLAKVDFQHQPEEIEKVDEYQVTGSDEDVAELAKILNEAGKSVGDVLVVLKKAWAEGKGEGECEGGGEETRPNGEPAPEGEGEGEGKAPPPKGKPEPEEEEAEKMQKMVGDALAPLQKRLDDLSGDLAKANTALAAANDKITKLESQPAAPTVRLRAVSKVEDTGGGAAGASSLHKAEPIVDDLGDAHEAAGLIKMLHRGPAIPMTMPRDR